MPTVCNGSCHHNRTRTCSGMRAWDSSHVCHGAQVAVDCCSTEANQHSAILTRKRPMRRTAAQATWFKCKSTEANTSGVQHLAPVRMHHQHYALGYGDAAPKQPMVQTEATGARNPTQTLQQLRALAVCCTAAFTETIQLNLVPGPADHRITAAWHKPHSICHPSLLLQAFLLLFQHDLHKRPLRPPLQPR